MARRRSFKRNAREDRGESKLKPTCRDRYTRWRMCQGFTQAEAEILLDGLDGLRDEHNEPSVYLDTLAKYQEQFSIGFQTIAKATMRLWDRYPDSAETYVKHISRLTTIANLVGTGYYDAATVLLRSSVEAFLRSDLLFVHDLTQQGLLSGITDSTDFSFSTSFDSQDALSIGQMCRVISKFNFTKKIRSPYHFMKIPYLNEVTHSNLNVIEVGDDNVLGEMSIRKVFDEDKCETFSKILHRFVEFQLVFWQCLIDTFDPVIQPIILLQLETPAHGGIFTKYQGVLESRFAMEFEEFFRIAPMYNFEESELPTMRQLIQGKELGFPKGWWELLRNH